MTLRLMITKPRGISVVIVAEVLIDIVRCSPQGGGESRGVGGSPIKLPGDGSPAAGCMTCIKLGAG